MNVYERWRAILEVLCVRRRETRENLAFKFGVSIRTIDYDIESLSLKYPIYTTQGKGGGISVIDGFYLDRKYLTGKQLSLLKKLYLNLSGEDAVIMKSIIKNFGLNRTKESIWR